MSVGRKIPIYFSILQTQPDTILFFCAYFETSLTSLKQAAVIFLSLTLK